MGLSSAVVPVIFYVQLFEGNYKVKVEVRQGSLWEPKFVRSVEETGNLRGRFGKNAGDVLVEAGIATCMMMKKWIVRAVGVKEDGMN